MLHYLFDQSFYEAGEENSVFLALFEEALRDAALRKLFPDSCNDILKTTAGALVGAARPGGEALSADEADGLAYLLLCAAVGNAHLSSTGISPAPGQPPRRVLPQGAGPAHPLTAAQHMAWFP